MNVDANEKADNELATPKQVAAESENKVLEDENVQIGGDIPVAEDVSDAEITVPNTEAAISEPDNTMEKEKEVIAKTISDALLEDLILKGSELELDSLDINDIEIYTYPIPIGTSSNSIVGYIKVEPYAEETTALIELTGNMLEGFDSSETGIKECILPISSFKVPVKIEVRENSDINDVGRIVDTDVTVGFNSSKQKNVVLVGDTAVEYGYISMLDMNGTSVCRVKFNIKEACPDFDSSTFGEKTYTMSYKDMPITFTVNFRRAAFMLVDSENREIDIPFIIPIGGNISNTISNTRMWTVTYDADNGAKYGKSYGFAYGEELKKQIDNTKAGIQEVELRAKDERGVIYTGTIKVKVGMPEQSTVEALLPPQAQATIPGGDVIGVWDVPSGEAGAGAWTFQTNLAEGTEVVVWSFHNNEWLKIGIYQVDVSGMVTVTFTADQLSPILITKNSEESGTDINNGSNSGTNTNNGSNSGTNTNDGTDFETNTNNGPDSETNTNNGPDSSKNYDSKNIKKTISPQTGDNAKTMILGITALLSLVTLVSFAYMKRKKINA